MPDIVDLIRAEHGRIRDLFARLCEGAAQDADNPARTWAEVSDLLETHLDAAAEIGYPPALTAVMGIQQFRAQMAADHGDIREAIREARLYPVATDTWWLAVHGVRTAAMRHIAVNETTLLDRLRYDMPRAARNALAEQWQALIAAQALDAREARLAPHPRGPERREI
jgi:hemerythrin HHE cation binding domain-containing protein